MSKQNYFSLINPFCPLISQADPHPWGEQDPWSNHWCWQLGAGLSCSTLLTGHLFFQRSGSGAQNCIKDLVVLRHSYSFSFAYYIRYIIKWAGALLRASNGVPCRDMNSGRSLTASRRATNWATPHPNLIRLTFFKRDIHLNKIFIISHTGPRNGTGFK